MYQRGSQNPYIEEEQTTQWPKEKIQKDKQESRKHTDKTNDRVTRTLLEHISNDGNWGKHVDLITKKVFTRVNIMRKFKFILDRRTLENIYLTFIRPLLEYGDVVWDCKTVYLTNKLESVQAEAARVVICRNRVGIFERQKVKT